MTGGSYSMDGNVQVNGAGLFNVTGGTATFTGTSTGSSGRLGIAGGTLTIGTGASFTTTGGFAGSSGVLNGAGTVTFGGASTWTGGNLNGAGGVTNFNGTLGIAAASQIIDGRTVNFGGASTVNSGTLTINNGGTLANSGTFLINTGVGLTINSTVGTGLLVNSGTINKAISSATATVASGVTFDNTGELNVSHGTFSLDGPVTQHSGTTLSGGTWNVSNGATLAIATGSNITTIASGANVTLDGAGSSFAKINTLTTNQGGFTLKNDRDFTTASAFTNSGTVSIQDSTTKFTIGSSGSAAYTQTGPSSVTILSGGAMIDSSAFNLNGGALRGTGTIDAPLTTSGTTTIAPGASPGTITVNGSTVLGSGNTLSMEVGGLASGIDYDVLVVNGVLTLGGLLDVDFINGFENSVAYDDVFTIATATSPILGVFSNVASGGLLVTNFSTKFEVWYGLGSPYGANNLVLTHTPEPSRAVLVLVGCAGLVMRRRRCR